MEQNSPEPLRLVSDFLAQTKCELEEGRISASDAILGAMRVARIHFLDQRLAALRRELLGYSEEEAAIATQYIRAYGKSDSLDWLQYAPSHRLIKGYAVPVLELLHKASSQIRLSVNTETRFCALSAAELESLKERAESTKTPHIVLDFDENENVAFVCTATELSGLLLQLSAYAATLIGYLLIELQDPSRAEDPNTFIAPQQNAA
jgi:hypothetical protein